MLKELFDKHNCDKGTSRHHYYKEYKQYFEPVREKQINLLEVGVFHGASTRSFNEYFPNINIFTIDIFVRTQPEDLDILQQNNIYWLRADSMDASLATKIKQYWGDIKFDFIIDDGAHWPEANRLTFENLIPFLKDDGTYFIEDVWPIDKMNTQQLLNPWLLNSPEKYNIYEHNLLLSTLEPYKSIHYDRRKETNCEDTYLIAIQK